jgi:CheY-like chemotaxis protein
MTAPKSILVVDDDPSVAKALQVLLRVNKHQVEVASDGETALARHKVGSHDLVITDFLMRGMDGLELARLIKARVPLQPVLLITGRLEAVSNEERGRLRHVDALLGKHFSESQLHEALSAVFPQG